MVTMNVSIPKKLSNQVEKILDDGEYSSRSELVRDALRNYIYDADVMTNVTGKVLGVLTVTYSLEGRSTTSSILRLQHTFANIILSTTHIHMNHTCMEAIIVKGTVERVRQLLDKTKATRGILGVKLSSYLQLD
ncbi:MAG: CopG family ribbon-helix-helix protein [Nitrososphaerales archaeon]